MKIARIERIVCGWADDYPDTLDVLHPCSEEKIGTARRKDEVVEAEVYTVDGKDIVYGRVLAELTIQEEFVNCDFFVTFCFHPGDRKLEVAVTAEGA